MNTYFHTIILKKYRNGYTAFHIKEQFNNKVIRFHNAFQQCAYFNFCIIFFRTLKNYFLKQSCYLSNLHKFVRALK